MGISMSNFEVGDEVTVRIEDSVVLEQMQANHGGWNDGMSECINGRCMVMQGLGNDVIINGPSGRIYRVNPEILSKYGTDEYNIGSHVAIIGDEEKMKKLHSGAGEWSDEMRNLLGKTVEIIEKLTDGSYSVKYDDIIWKLKPESFDSTKEVKEKTHVSVGDKVTVISEMNEVKTLQAEHGGWNELMNILVGKEVEVAKILDDGDCYVTYFGMQWMVNPKCFSHNKKKKEKKSKFKKGDKVIISDDLEKCKKKQKNHGGWVSNMKSLLGKTGTVDAIFPTGDVKVNVKGISLVYNPKLLTKTDEEAVAEPEFNSSFSIGDIVKVLDDKKQVKQLQKGHGEWNDSMSLILGEKGKVKGIYPDGDIRVKIMGNTLTLNPACVKKQEQDDDSDDDDTPDVMKMMKQMAKMLAQDDSEETDVSDLLKGKKMELFIAVKTGDVEQTKALVDLVGPNVSQQKIFPLLLAVNESHEEIIKILLDKGADIDAQDKDGDTSLHLAVLSNRVEICRLLVERGADVNVRNKKKVTAIMIAAVTGVQEILKILVFASNADLNVQDKDKDTALHLAIQKSRLDSVEILLEAGADINALNEKEFTPFHVAALVGHERILEAFLKRHGPLIINSKKEDGFGALHVATINNHTGCVKLLLKYNADVNLQNEKLQSALHLAVSQKYLGCVKVLVEGGADVNIQDNCGDTPTHDGVRLHNTERLKKIGSLLGLAGMAGLMGLTRGGTDTPEDIVMYLAKNGANFYLKNNDGKTVVDLCGDELLKARLMSLRDGSTMNEVTIETSENVISAADQEQIELMKKRIKELEESKICEFCHERKIEIALGCGHMSCEICSKNWYECNNCHTAIESRIKIYK